MGHYRENNNEQIASALISISGWIEKYREKIDALTGGIEIGSNASTKAFRDWLYATQQLPVLNRTDKGMPAMDDEAMILLKEWCQDNKPELTALFDNVIEYRKWAKLKTTYLDGYTKAINPVTGRIHPDLMPLKAATGRFACSNPNLQNQVAVSEDPIGVRDFMVAPEGWSLLECDYSQAEIRLVAFLSQDQVLLDAYRRGEDVHAITTSAVFRIPLEEAKDKSRPDYKHRRTVAKQTMFGIMYGIAGRGLSRNLHTNAGVVVTPEECNSYIDGMHSGKKAEEGASKESAQGKGRVTEHVGAMVGVSHNMVNQVMKIIRVADEETKAKLRCGDLSVNAVYQAIRREETKAEPDDDMAGGQDTSDTQTGDKPDTHTPRHTGGNTLSPLLDKPIITDPLQTAHIDGPIAFHPVVPDDDRDAGEPEYGEPSFEDGDNDAGEQVREMVDEFLEELGEVLETADAADAGHILEQVQRMTDTATAAIRDKMKEMEE